jgi:undecaprenyldiphospho-muramoylpentapeptide beta-N-acetylglucosaminyltransferase
VARPWAVLAGGGTGGHWVPVLAVAEALVARGHPRSSIHLLGSRRTGEAELYPASGFPCTLLPGRGINERKLNLANVAAAGALGLAGVEAVWLLARLRPRVLLSVGGFASVPPAGAAVALRIPLVLAAQNAVPTAGNRIFARWARAAAVAFEGTPLPRAVLTGNPVRDEILDVDPGPEGRARARAALGLPADRFVVFAFGGSLGSRRINQAVAGLAEQWRGRGDVAIRHVWGRRDWSPDCAVLRAPDALTYQGLEYEHDMASALAAADVVVARAGGGTVAELAVVGRPAVLVPLPIAAEDNQMANARAFEAAGAVSVVRDDELDATRLEAELSPLLADPARLRAMGRAAASLGHRDAADRVAELLERHARP